MTEHIQSIIKAIKGKRFNLQDEKELQMQMFKQLAKQYLSTSSLSQYKLFNTNEK